MSRTLDKSLVLAAMLAVVSFACTSSEPTRPSGSTGTAGSTGASGTSGAAGTGAAGTSGTAGTTGTAGTSGTAGTTGTAGTSGTAGATGTAGVTGTAGTTGTAGAGGTGGGTDAGAGATGTAGTGSGDGGAGKVPTCVSNDVAGATARVNTNYSECDVQDQAIDFDVAAGFAASLYNGKVLKPGYDPSLTPVTISAYGTAFSGYQVQSCHPYCYQSNLTIGVDFVPGSDAALRGEIFFDFPTTGSNLTGLPITNASGRASLGWIYLDGPALPAGAKVTAQMELKSTDNGLLVSTETKMVPLKTWVEFRYFPIDSTFTAAKLTNITTIGFKLTMATAGAAEWHGSIYADHFQLRK